jgi:glycosyltransferase involved in cell wall biosynthesis
MRVNYEATVSALAESEAYIVDAQQAPRVTTTPEVMVAIPAYNEAATIEDVVRESMTHAETVVVIDDGSTDDTVERAAAAGAETIVHETNQGYGGALQTAFREAKRAGADQLVILDGDGQHDPTDIPELVRTQEEEDAEIVIGSRLVDEGTTDAPLYRRVGLSVVNAVTNLSLGVVRPESRIRDTQSGFRAYSRPAIESLAADGEIGTQMSASTDILYHAHHRDYDVVEVGTEITYDGEHTSSQHPVTHGVTLIMNLLRTVERDRPVTVLGVPGFISALLGIGFGYFTFSNYITSGTFPLGLAVTSVFFALSGILACFTAIILHAMSQYVE